MGACHSYFGFVLFGDPSRLPATALTEEQLRAKSTAELKRIIAEHGLDHSGCRTKNELAHLAWLGEYDEETRPPNVPSDDVPTMQPVQTVPAAQEAQEDDNVGEASVGISAEMLTIQIPSEQDKTEHADWRTLHMIQAQCNKLGPDIEAHDSDDQAWSEAVDLLDLISQAAKSNPEILKTLYGNYTDVDKNLRNLAVEVKAVIETGKDTAEFKRLLQQELKVTIATSTLHCQVA